MLNLFLIYSFYFCDFFYMPNEINTRKYTNNNKNAIMSIVDKFLTIEKKKNKIIKCRNMGTETERD